MATLLLVMTGGALGAGARYGLSVWLGGAGSWLAGTLLANLSGGLLMGLLAGLIVAEPARLFLGVGLLGGFTTFSAFSLEVVTLVERGQWGAGFGYALVSAMGAVVACGLGLAAAKSLA